MRKLEKPLTVIMFIAIVAFALWAIGSNVSCRIDAYDLPPHQRLAFIQCSAHENTTSCECLELSQSIGGW